MKTYTVKRGDTLSGIARAHGVCTTELATINKLKDPDFIRVGQILRIPEVRPSNYEKIGEAVCKCLQAIEGLEEFKELSGLLED